MPRSPESLSSREGEVLELVPQGLTNDQIAEELGITSDGVKYHISQILSKLGVESRHEAAEMVFRHRRPPWSGAVASIGWRAVGAALVIGVLAFLAVLLFGVVRSNSNGDDAPHAQDIFDSAAEAASSGDSILHTNIQAEQGGVLRYTVEMWVDGAKGALRYNFTPVNLDGSDGTPEEAVNIVIDEHSYFQESPGIAKRDAAKGCPGMKPWLSVFLLCTEGEQPRVEEGVWEGSRAVVLVYERSYIIPTSEDLPTPQATVQTEATSTWPPTGTPLEGVETLVARLYLDAGTYLPLAWMQEHRTNGEPVDEFGDFVLTYEHEFVPRSPEIMALLDPKSIGYGVEDVSPLEQLAESMPVFWLGEEYEAESSLESLVLAEMTLGSNSGPAASLLYTTPTGSSAVDLTLWRPEDWKTFRESTVLADDRCATTTRERFASREFTVFSLPPVQYPLPSPGTSSLADCWHGMLDDAISETGEILVWETEGVVVAVSPIGLFRSNERFGSVVSEALRPYP